MAPRLAATRAAEVPVTEAFGVWPGTATQAAFPSARCCTTISRGFRQFLLRGIDKVQGKWGLVMLAYNWHASAQPGEGMIEVSGGVFAPH